MGSAGAGGAHRFKCPLQHRYCAVLDSIEPNLGELGVNSHRELVSAQEDVSSGAIVHFAARSSCDGTCSIGYELS